jgi:hypothetical protein
MRILVGPVRRGLKTAAARANTVTVKFDKAVAYADSPPRQREWNAAEAVQPFGRC